MGVGVLDPAPQRGRRLLKAVGEGGGGGVVEQVGERSRHLPQEAHGQTRRRGLRAAQKPLVGRCGGVELAVVGHGRSTSAFT